MSPKELADKTIKDIQTRRQIADREFYAYQKEQVTRKKRGWNIKYGGFRY